MIATMLSETVAVLRNLDEDDLAHTVQGRLTNM